VGIVVQQQEAVSPEDRALVRTIVGQEFVKNSMLIAMSATHAPDALPEFIDGCVRMFDARRKMREEVRRSIARLTTP
jgi:hypothetical protein